MSSIRDMIQKEIAKWYSVYLDELQIKAIPVINDFHSLATANASHVYDLISHVKIPFEKIQMVSLVFFALNPLLFCKYSLLRTIGLIVDGLLLYNIHQICAELDTLQDWVFTYKKEEKHLPLNDTIDKTKKLLNNIWHSTHIKTVLETVSNEDFEKKFNDILQRLDELKASRFKQVIGNTWSNFAGFLFGKNWSF